MVSISNVVTPEDAYKEFRDCGVDPERAVKEMEKLVTEGVHLEPANVYEKQYQERKKQNKLKKIGLGLGLGGAIAGVLVTILEALS
jgi:hypothetical protein